MQINVIIQLCITITCWHLAHTVSHCIGIWFEICATCFLGSNLGHLIYGIQVVESFLTFFKRKQTSGTALILSILRSPDGSIYTTLHNLKLGYIGRYCHDRSSNPEFCGGRFRSISVAFGAGQPYLGTTSPDSRVGRCKGRTGTGGNRQ